MIQSMDTSTITGRVAFGLVHKAKNKDYARGHFLTANKNLKKKYAPETAPTLAKYQSLFYTSKMKKVSDPDIFISKLEEIGTRSEIMDQTMTDEQFMVHVLINLTSDYRVEVNILSRKIGSKY